MSNFKSIRNLYQLFEDEILENIAESDRYKEILMRRSMEEDLLHNCVDSSIFSIFEDYIDCECEMEELNIEESFVFGFSLAFRLILDSLN